MLCTPGATIANAPGPGTASRPDTPVSVSPTPGHPAYTPADTAVLDHVLFAGHGWFIALDTANIGTATTTAWEQAQRWLATDSVATVAGTLPEQVLAADIDAADTGAEAEAGEAVADDLIAWCETRGLPWLLRTSGRPGGHHVLALTPDTALQHEWRQLCTRLASHHGVGTQPRHTLRLLSAPHRHGYPAPLLAGTLRPDDLPAPPEPTSTGHDPSGAAAPPRRRRRRRRQPTTTTDRSAREFGTACARARAGWTTDRAWAAAAQPGSKAAEMGEAGWRRWMWCKAVNIAAAEQNVSEAEAWHRFEHASPLRARELGREAWRTQYWQPALDEAATDRPRRTHPHQHDAASQPSADHAAEQAEIETIRAGLRHTADEQITATGRRPQFARSLAAALDALAIYIVRRDGSLSERAWAEAAHLSRSTLRTVLRFARDHEILTRTRAYTGGTADSASWHPGPAATPAINHVRKTRPTRWYTTPARSWGTADLGRLRREHARERRSFRLRQVLSAYTDTTGESYKTSQHPAARTLRSLRHQRRWWSSLSPQQREQRRAHRRQLLHTLHHTERSAWFDWLNRRTALELHADRVHQGHRNSHDDMVLAEAPSLVHLGMRAPYWRTGARSPSSEDSLVTSQPQLAMTA